MPHALFVIILVLQLSFLLPLTTDAQMPNPSLYGQQYVGSNNSTLTNVRVAKTANYTVRPADCGKTFALGGNTLFTLTLPAASTLPATCAILALNEDIWGSGRGKVIAPDSKQSFILWPGMPNASFNDGESSNTAVIYSSGNAWHVQRATRAKLPAGTTNFYAGSTGINNVGTNDCMGTGTGACASAQFWLGDLLDQFDFNGTNSGQSIAKLNLQASWSDTGDIHWSPSCMPGRQGGGAVIIDGGGTATLAGANVNSATIQLYFCGFLQLQNLTVTSGAGKNGIEISEHGTYIQGPGVTFNVGGNAIYAYDTGEAYLGSNGFTVSGIGATNCVLQESDTGNINGSGLTITQTANLTGLAFYCATRSGNITMTNITYSVGGFTFTGGQLNVQANAYINTSAAGGTLPGSGRTESLGGCSSLSGAACLPASGYTGFTSCTNHGIVSGQGGGALACTAAANNATLVTDGSGVPSLSTALPSGIAGTNMALTTPILAGYAIASLPTGTIGMQAYVTDQITACPALGIAPTNGGALKCRVWYNGTAWVGD